MSDSESYSSTSPRGHHQQSYNQRYDQRLDDHRNQPASLPIPQPPTVSINSSVLGDEPSSANLNPVSILETGRTSHRAQRRTSLSHSFGDGGLDPKDQRHLNVTVDAPMKVNASVRRKRRDTMNDNLEADLASPMTRHRTNDTTHSGDKERERRPSNSSIDSEANSHGSRSSQETEEDVCFPMLREHVRVNGIDFDEIDEFINEERDAAKIAQQQQQMINDRLNTYQGLRPTSKSSSSAMRQSTASLKYTPKNILKRTATAFTRGSKRTNDENCSIQPIPDLEKQHPSDSSTMNEYEPKATPCSDEFVSFADPRIVDSQSDDASPLPERFSFFTTNQGETIHAPDIPSLTEVDQSIREVFNNGEGTWWLDCTCPTDAEMKVLSKAFGLHPLTSEDIRVQESREKVELFRNYYFVCFHTFEPDKESEDYLEPINVYMVVFREGILSFHFSPVTHSANVRRRVRQLRDYVDVSADWICYAIIDNITDGFGPVITAIEYEADAIEDSVLVARETDFSTMLKRIGESRRKVMTLMRLLSGKADVIKMFAKRCQDEVYSLAHSQSQANLDNSNHYNSPSPAPVSTNVTAPLGFSHDGTGGISFGPNPGAPPNMVSPLQYQFQPSSANITQPRGEIALYLGDIQDHVVTMFQNLLAYEKIFSRSHANYLAQLQVESVNSNNNVTVMLSQVTLLGTLLLPLNVITGLFGMNVTVPGQATGQLRWFFGIVGVMVCIVTFFFIFARIWLKRLLNPAPMAHAPTSTRRSIRSLGLIRGKARSIASFPGYE